MTIGWGIIGCGSVTEVKSGPGFQKARDSRLVAVMRRDARLAEDYARRHGVPRWYSNADALIADRDVDAVYIASPPGTHLELALKVCAARKPCYVEKPMARNHRECQQMVDAFAAAGVPLFVAYYRRCLPRFMITRDLIASGRLGTITGISCRHASVRGDATATELPWRLQAEHSGGGIFVDLASHSFDLLEFWFGELAEMQGMAANVASPYAVEDVATVMFRTAAGALGTATWNFASATACDAIEITGTDAQLCLSKYGDDPLRLIQRDGRVETIVAPNPPHVAQPLIQTIVDELMGRGRCPSPGVSAARANRWIDLVLAQYYGGRDDAFWARPSTWPGRRH